MKKILIGTALLAFMTLTAGWLHAQVPQLISYQGRVGVDGVNFDGSGQFKFAFVNAAGTTTYWSNDGSSTAGSEPGTAIDIPVSKGLYAVLLGDATLAHMSIVPATVFTNGDVHLRVWFSDGVNGFQKLTPDRRIAAVGYAMMADSVSDGAITTAKIADGAVTSAKLAAGVVQTANLATGAVGNAQLANSALTINAGTGLGGGGLVSLGGNVTLSNAGVLSLTGGGGISVDAGTGAITLGSSATSAGTAGAIVARDASGGFTAGTITAALNGNAATATSATSFTGLLTGDVTGTQAATTIADATVTGKVLTGFTSASGTLTASDTLLSAISKLDGNVALKAPLASPTFTGSVTLPAGSATAAPLLLQTGPPLTTPALGAVEFDGTNLFVTNNSASPTRKTVAFTDSTIAAAQIPDGTITSAKLTSNLTLGGTTSGTFSGNLTGNVTGNVSGSAASFTGSLTGDVTGTQAATVVSTVGGVTSTSLAAGATLANAATHANTASTLVRRDASGNFSAGTITAALNGNASTATSAPSFTGMLAGDVTGTQGATVVSAVGTSTAANVHAAELAANSATSANTPSTIMKRDANGDFSAGTITASTFMGRGALPWVVVSGTSHQAVSNTGYVADSTDETTITLPISPSVGDVVGVTGAGNGGWRIGQNTGQSIVATTLKSPPDNYWVPRTFSDAWDSIASSANGSKLVATTQGNEIYTSTDYGVTWIGRESERNWREVTSSIDGVRLAAVVENGQIYVSADSGITWQPRESNRSWQGIASSSDGSKIVAVAHGGQIYTSPDYGVTWTARDISRTWFSVASSSDGTKLIAAAQSGFLYTSSDSGITWSQRHISATWMEVASSSDGIRLAAVAQSSQVYTSEDAGLTWIARDSSRNWQSLAMSSNGEMLVAGVYSGQLYISRNYGVSWSAYESNRAWTTVACSGDGLRLMAAVGGGAIYGASPTAAGPTFTTVSSGFIRGGQYSSIVLQYIGDNRFIPVAVNDVIVAF